MQMEHNVRVLKKKLSHLTTNSNSPILYLHMEEYLFVLPRDHYAFHGRR